MLDSNRGEIVLKKNIKIIDPYSAEAGIQKRTWKPRHVSRNHCPDMLISSDTINAVPLFTKSYHAYIEGCIPSLWWTVISNNMVHFNAVGRGDRSSIATRCDSRPNWCKPRSCSTMQIIIIGVVANLVQVSCCPTLPTCKGRTALRLPYGHLATCRHRA